MVDILRRPEGPTYVTPERPSVEQPENLQVPENKPEDAAGNTGKEEQATAPVDVAAPEKTAVAEASIVPGLSSEVEPQENLARLLKNTTEISEDKLADAAEILNRATDPNNIN